MAELNDYHENGVETGGEVVGTDTEVNAEPQRPEMQDDIPSESPTVREKLIESVRQEIVDQPERKVLADRGEETYEIEGTKVSVRWVVYKPEKEVDENIPKENGVVFLPGWGSSSSSKSTEPLAQSFANEATKSGGSITISIDTRAEEVVENSLEVEAEAIRKFLSEKTDLKDIVIAGHSQGGQKAANLAVKIEASSSEMNIQGLVLIDSVGMYAQTKLGLIKNFIADSIASLPKSIFIRRKADGGDDLGVHHGENSSQPLKEIHPRYAKRLLQAGNDIGKNIGNEVIRSKSGYLKRFKNEVSEMSQKNPNLAEVSCPVVVFGGVEDKVSSPEKIALSAEEGLAENQVNDNKSIDPREELLKGLFPKSPSIKWVQAKRIGHHGLPLARSEQVAANSLFLLRRHDRQEKKAA